MQDIIEYRCAEAPKGKGKGGKSYCGGFLSTYDRDGGTFKFRCHQCSTLYTIQFPPGTKLHITGVSEKPPNAQLAKK